MVAAVLVLGLVAEAAAWWTVATGGRSVWTTVVPVAGGLGVAALALGPPAWSGRVPVIESLAAGAWAGSILYLATRAFVRIVRGWVAFRRDALRVYGRRGRVPLGLALALSVGVSAAGEELFWRGLFRAHVAGGSQAPVASALVTWAAFVLANLPSANLAVVAGALVGGAVWTGLALWTDGVLASVLCHGVWTALMVSAPVVRPPTGGPGPP